MMLGCGNEGDPFAVFEQRPGVRVSAVNPPDGATGISVNAVVTVAYPLDLNPRTVIRESFNLVDPAGIPVARTVRYDAVTRVVTIRPTAPLRGATLYQLIVQGVEADSGQVRLEPELFTFATGDAPATGAPEVVSVTPLPNQANVNVNAPITITFSEPMDPSSLQAAFSISEGTAGTFALSADGTVLTFTPGAPLTLGRQIVVQVSTLATDTSGVPLNRGFTSTFTTPVPGTFRLLASVPADGATTAAPGALLRYTFSEPVDRTTVATNFAISNDALAVPAPSDANFTYANADQVVFYDPRPSLPGFVGFPGASTVQTTFTADLLSAVSGIGLVRAEETRFVVENIPPQVLRTDPVNGMTDVAADQVIRFFFDEPIDRNTVDLTSFSVSQGPVVTGVITFEDGDRTVVFTPNAPYANSGVPVVATASTAVTDLGGTALAAAATLSFAIDTVPPFVTGFFPDSGATQVPVTLSPLRSIQISFNEALDQAATIASVTLAPAPATAPTVIFQGSNTVVIVPAPIVPPVNPPAAPNAKLLDGATTYTVDVTGFDLSGNAANTTLTFTADNQPPGSSALGVTVQVDGVIAPNNLITMNPTPTIQVTYDELLDKDTLAVPGAVALRQTTPVVQDVMITPTFDDLGFTFTAPTLTPNTSYEVVVATSVTDLGGNAPAAPFVFAFQVVP